MTLETWIPRANAVFPAGTTGNFDATVLIKSAKGSRLWDQDGREYIDYLIGSGPMILGHCHPEIDAEITAQLKDGLTFFANNTFAIELAEEICTALPCADMLRYVSTGGRTVLMTLETWIPRANAVFPAGTTGNFDATVLIKSAKGSRLWDQDGREYIDYLIGSGPMILGHCHPEIDAEITAQLKDGLTFFANNTFAIELAEEICTALPCADMLRYVSTGEDCLMTLETWIPRANAVFPAGTTGNFDATVLIKSAKGSRLWDQDGREYIDYLIGSGPMILGHCHPEIDAEITAQLKDGLTFFANNTFAIELAEEI